MSIENSTITGNYVTGTGSNGSAVFTDNTATGLKPQPTYFFDSIVAGNDVRPGVSEIEGPVAATSAYNIFGDGSAAGLTNGVNGNHLGTAGSPINPLLGPLQNNGGPTETMALLPGSPALNAGSTTGVPATDQRGLPRVVNGLVDIGAWQHQPPTVVQAASAASNPVIGTTVNLIALGADDAGETSPTYTWTVTSKPAGAATPTFSVNGSTSAQNTIATFTQAGSYTFAVTIQDPLGLAATSSVTVTVNQTLTSIVVTPASATVNDGAAQQFAATAKDQFGNVLSTQPSFTWSLANGSIGTLSSSGLYTAPSTGSGSATVTASSGAISGTAAVTVSSSNPPAAPTGLTASPASGQVSLTWTASSGATSYDIYRGTSSGGETLLASGVTGTSFTDSGLTNGTTYYYEVTAVNSGGQSSKSSEVAATAGLTIAQIQALPYSQFKTLTPVQVQYLTVAQIATIPNVTWLGTLSAADRAALSTAQVQALKPAAIDGTLLTPTQFAELTVSQVQGLGFSEFRYLDPAQIPDLTLAQVGSIPNTSWLGTLSAADRAALSTAQVQALKPAAIDGTLLTPAQLAELTVSQIQGLGFSEFRYLDPAQVPDLTLAQVGSIPNTNWLGTLSAADRAALSTAQVQALKPAAIDGSLLTPAQFAVLTVTQIQELGFSEFRYLDPAQIPDLTLTQCASHPERGLV